MISILRPLMISLAAVALTFSAAAANEGGEPRPDLVPRQGSLIICGGGRLDDSIIERFFALAGGPEAKLVVIPTASRRADRLDDKTLLGSWSNRDLKRLTVLHTRNRIRANRAEFVAPLRDATAVWISGGSQTLLAEAYRGTRVENELHALLKRGGVIGGTSAGAAIMSQTMIAMGNPNPVIIEGLGLLPGAIIDQHFLVRNRLPRSVKAVTKHPDRFGVGIDEATAVEVHDDAMRVLGSSTVTITLAATPSKPLDSYQLKAGETADLAELRKESAERAKEINRLD